MLWTVACFGDRLLTLWGASLRRKGRGASVTFEGSYELTAEWQKEVDQGRLLSSKFVISVLFYAGLLGVLGQFVANDSMRTVYLVVLGGLLVVDVPIYLRHIRNISWMLVTRHVPRPPQTKLPRYLAYRISGIDLLAFAALFALAGVADRSSFILGGAGTCLILGVKNLRLGSRPAGAGGPVDAVDPPGGRTGA
jgi:hypothetical protein